MPRKAVQDLATVAVDRYQVAAYIHEMSIELARFAQRHDLPSLATLLEMAAIDALDQSARPLEPPAT